MALPTPHSIKNAKNKWLTADNKFTAAARLATVLASRRKAEETKALLITAFTNEVLSIVAVPAEAMVKAKADADKAAKSKGKAKADADKVAKSKGKEPAKAEPAKAEPVKAEPAKAETASKTATKGKAKAKKAPAIV